MKSLFACLVSLLVVFQVAHPRAQTAPPAGEPAIRLVLLIAVDQFRADYITRFGAEYRGGLTRLLSEGAVFTNANLEHYPSVTAVGHATMLTGATPAVSGIIGNDWYDRALGAPVTSVSDPATQLVGGSKAAGSSPRRLLVGTLGDELRVASSAAPGSDRAPKVIGISLKDRSAILMAGHAADLALWYDDPSGNFVTSTYYRSELPAWAGAFNAGRPADALAGKRWTFRDPSSGPGRILPAEKGPKLYAAIEGTPFGNDLVAALAEAALAGERLGQRGVTDLLAVSFSSNDVVGHSYGPDSPEVRDISVRTDELLGRFLSKVDAVVGPGRTLVVFTADHGVAPVPEVQAARKMPGGRLKGAELFGPIEFALVDRFGEGTWVIATAGSTPYLNHALIAEKKLDPAEVRRAAAAAAATVPRVARVYTREQLLSGAAQVDVLGRRVVRSYNAQRSGDLEILLEPYWMRSTTGTTHGTPYAYDTRIPLMFMGPGIRPGMYHDPVSLNDLAPTLATMLGIEPPEAADGRPLTEMLAAPTASNRRLTPE